MHARFFTVFNTVPPFIVINRVSSPSFKPQPLLLSIPLQEGNVSIKTPLILHCNPILQSPQHACKHFYGIQHSSTVHCHQPSLIPEFGTTTTSALDPTTRGTFLLKLHPLQPNVTAPTTCMQAFLRNPTQFHLSLSSTESHPRVWKPHTPPSALDPTTRGNVSIKTPLQPNVTAPQHAAPQHACKHFYGLQHSSTFHCHQLSVIPEFGSHTPFCSRSHYKRGTFLLKLY